MNYTYLTPEKQAQMLLERLSAMEAEHYHHEINRRIGQQLAAGATGAQLDEARKMIAMAEAAQATIAVAYQAAQATLDELTEVRPAGPPTPVLQAAESRAAGGA